MNHAPLAVLLLAFLSIWSGCTALAAPGDKLAFPKDAGVLNIRDFGAKGDGVSDDTEAFKKAVALGDDKARFLFIPNGTYLLTDTIGWSRRRTLMGESRQGVILKLADKTPGYSDPAKPKPLIHAAVPGSYYGTDSWANAAFANYIQNLTIDTGKGNPGAIAMIYTTHNYGMVEHVTLRSGDRSGAVGLDLRQTEFGPGMVRDLLVEGFDIGIAAPSNVSNAVFDTITLRNQNKVGLENQLPVSIRKLTTENDKPGVPAIRHGKAGQLVLVEARLNGVGDGPAIEAKGGYYLRDVKTTGYAAALEADGKLIQGANIEEYIGGQVHVLGDAPKKSLGLPMQDPPVIFNEPMQRWLVVSPSGGDDTAKLQQALNSGRGTIFMTSGNYKVRATLTVPTTVRRILSTAGASLNGPRETFGIGDLMKPSQEDIGGGKPFFRIEGKTKDSLTFERIGVGAWPYRVHMIQIASPRPVYLRHGVGGHPGGEVRTADGSQGGSLFLDETAADLRITGDYHVFAWQYNPENNPFNTKSPTMKNRTYIVNDGGSVWILGYKTESPAIHAITRNGGRTEVLGGFFRDHFGGQDYGGEIPYFIVENGSTSANYVQFAWQHGKARALQLLDRAGDREETITLSPDTFSVSLLRADAIK